MFSGAFAIAGAAYSFLDGLFAKSEPLKLSIELELAGKLSGTVMVSHTQGPVWTCYLPGRFSIEEAYPRGLAMNTSALHSAIPTYDRTVGLFGYAYSPGEVRFRMVRWDAPDRGESSDTPAFVLPGSPTPDLLGRPFDARQAHPHVDRFLPAIYNEYAEIEFAKPLTLSVDTHQVPPTFEVIDRLLPLHEPPDGWQTRWRWHANHAWSAHVTPEAADSDFPRAIQDLIAPDLSRMDIVAYLGGVEQLRPAGSGVTLQMLAGLTLQVEPRASYMPCTYRDFWTHEQRDFKVMQWYGCSVLNTDLEDAAVARPFQPDEPFPIQDVVFEWAHEYFYYARTDSDRTAPSRRCARRPTSDRLSPWRWGAWRETTCGCPPNSLCTRFPALSFAERPPCPAGHCGKLGESPRRPSVEGLLAASAGVEGAREGARLEDLELLVDLLSQGLEILDPAAPQGEPGEAPPLGEAVDPPGGGLAALPRALDESVALHAPQSRVERARTGFPGPSRQVLDGPGQLQAVAGRGLEQAEHVERQEATQQISG